MQVIRVIMGNKITRRRPVIDERYTRPQGLYPCRDVDQKKLRRLILEHKLAPCYPGAEDPATDLEECPICFLQYPSLNRSKCCTKGICTECFLQMKTPHSSRPSQCPFCKTPNYAVEFRGAKTLEEKGMEQAEEQKVIEAKIRMRQQELQDDEERQKRREEDIRLGRIRLPTPRAQPNNNHPTSIAPVDETEGLNLFSAWGNTNRQPQALATPAVCERNTSAIDPYSLWVDGDYQRAAGIDVTNPFQQSAVSISPNAIPSVNQQQTEIDSPSPRFSPGAPGSRQREDFDLDLEDIMVMEAIWLSIQEQGARHRFADGEATRPSELVTEINLDSDADVNSAPGGLAGAIAALAERQAFGGNTAPSSHPTTTRSTPPPDPDVDHSTGEVPEPLESTGNEPGRQTHEEPSRWAEDYDSTETVASTPARDEEPEISTRGRAPAELTHWEDHGGGSSISESLDESGTSFARLGVPSENTPSTNDEVLLPDSFEEQVVLAMALSIADAQASRVHQVDTRSGPLFRHTH